MISRPPRAIERARAAGPIALGTSDRDLWLVAGETATFGPHSVDEEMDHALGGSPPQVAFIQNNQANFVDAASHQTLVQVGVAPEVALQLQQDAIGARRETSVVAQTLLCEGRKAIAAAESDKEALRVQGRQVVAAAQALRQEDQRAVAAANAETEMAQASAREALADRDSIVQMGRQAVAAASSETASAREAERKAREETSIACQ